MAVVEHQVDVPLRGTPRWWTVTNPQGSREVVRVVLTVGKDLKAETARRLCPPGHEVRTKYVVYAVLKTGQFAWPPLAGPALVMGRMGWQSLEEGGAKVAIAPSVLGQKLAKILKVDDDVGFDESDLSQLHAAAAIIRSDLLDDLASESA